MRKNKFSMPIVASGGSSGGGSGIDFVDTLPTPSEEEYNKHKLYLKDGELYFLNSIVESDPTIEEKNTSLRQTWGVGTGFKDNKIYQIAGNVLNTVSNVISYYDIESNTETTLETTFPTNLYNFGYAQYGDYVYTFGGATTSQGSSTINKIYKIDLNTMAITELEATCHRCQQASSCIVGNYIYTFGGTYYQNGWQYPKTITMFDVETETTTTLSSQLINSNQGMATVAVGTTIYLIGGVNDKNIYAFDTINQTITKVWDYNLSLSRFYYYGGFVIGTMIYLVGGFESDENIYTFDTITNTFTTLTQQMPYNMKFNPSIAKLDNATFYVLGYGHAEKVYFATNISYKQITSTDVN